MIEVAGLVKWYGDVPALRGLDLRVEEGSVLGLIGANGAGKTTLVRVLATLIRPDAGWARVAGHPVVGAGHEVRSRLGLTGQYATLDERLTGRENLELIDRLHHRDARHRRRRTEELLASFSLTDVAARRVDTYSGGMRRRLDVAAGLIGGTPVVVLDEPTTGLDPRTRTQVWGIVRGLAEQGTTVLLTTQYLEEADRLADQVVLIESGRALAGGSPDELKDLVGGSVLEARVSGKDLQRAAEVVGELNGGRPTIDAERQRLTVSGATPSLVSAAFEGLLAADVEVLELGVRRASLDEVFLTLTDGTRTVDDRGPGAPPGPRLPPAGAAAHQPTEDEGPAGTTSPRRPVTDLLALTSRNLRRTARSPQTLALTLGQPILLLLGFRYLLGGALGVADPGYVQYLLPGLFTAAVLIASGGTAISLTQDLQSGILDRFRSLPIARSAVLAGRTTADEAVNLVALAAIVALGVPLGFEFRGSAAQTAMAVALLALLGYSLTWMYAALGMALRTPEASYAAGTVTLFLLLFSSSAFVRIETMPDWLQPIARVQPVTVTIDAVRALSNGLPAAQWPAESAAWSVAILAASAAFAIQRYRDLGR